jgi:prepilin-type N-terminal cleavage/methylation domain-containing protein
MMTPNASEAGFTLIELLMASVLSSLLMIAAFGMLYDSIRIADVLRSRVQLNAAARESFDILLNGGISDSTEVTGLRGRNTIPDAALLSEINPADLNNSNFRVKLDSANGASASLRGPTTVSQKVTCTAPKTPIPACQNGITLAVNGYLGGAPQIHENTRRVSDRTGENDRTGEIELTLASPYLLSDTAEDVTTAQSVEIYRTIFQLYGDR